jgi:hypothetical protein
MEPESFLRSHQLLSYSRISQLVMEHEGSSPSSQQPATGLYPEPEYIFQNWHKPSKLTPWLESTSELYRPTERSSLVGEVSANFSG